MRPAFRVGLGNDGAASNNDLDMFEAMRQAALLHKLDLRRSPRDARAGRDRAWRPSTGPGDRDGPDHRFPRGRQARRPDRRLNVAARQTPLYDPLSHLVYVTRGDDVRTTIVNGRILMRDRKVLTLNAEQVLADARALALRVREAVKAGKRPTP